MVEHKLKSRTNILLEKKSHRCCACGRTSSPTRHQYGSGRMTSVAHSLGIFILWIFLFGSIFLQRPPPQARPSSGLRRRTLTTWWGGSSILYLIFSTWWPSHSSIWYLKILTTWLPSLLPHIWSFLAVTWQLNRWPCHWLTHWLTDSVSHFCFFDIKERP